MQIQAQAHGYLSELAWVFHLYFVMFPASTSLVGSFHLSNYPLPLSIPNRGHSLVVTVIIFSAVSVSYLLFLSVFLGKSNVDRYSHVGDQSI
jgi:hypothetical protein